MNLGRPTVLPETSVRHKDITFWGPKNDIGTYSIGDRSIKAVAM